MKNCIYSQLERSVGSNLGPGIKKSIFKKCFFYRIMGLAQCLGRDSLLNLAAATMGATEVPFHDTLRSLSSLFSDFSRKFRGVILGGVRGYSGGT